MKNKSNYYNLIWSMLLMAFIGSLFAACSKMNDTYKDFIKDGQIIYPGKADSARVHSGRYRLVLAWPASTDPKVTTAKIYWNNRTDSIEIPVEPKSVDQPVISVPFNDLLEGSYTFEIFTFDKNGNQSIKVETLGRAYGDAYESALLSRPIDATNFENDTLNIFWGAVPDTTAIGSEIIYMDKGGIEQEIFISKASGTTEIPYFAPGMIKHRTVYLPNQWAIDTFYTEYTSQRIKGLPIELSKAGWEATASSFDSRSGNRYRPPSLAIDGDPTTIWVNQVSPQEEYPHTITVDMGSVRDEIEGFAIITRVGDESARPKTVELLTSKDDVELISEDDVVWHTHGVYILENTGDMQFIAIPEVVQARHFRMIAKDPQKADKNIALAEIGLYTR